MGLSTGAEAPELLPGHRPAARGLAAALQGNAYARSAPVYVQSFEVGPLRTTKRLLGTSMPNVKIVQLIGGPSSRPADWRLAGDTRSFAEMLTPLGLREVATLCQRHRPREKQRGATRRPGRSSPPPPRW